MKFVFASYMLILLQFLSFSQKQDYRYDTLYYKFNQGTQMIEIRQRVSYSKQNLFSYASDFWSIKENLPIYIWRNERGEIVKTENIFGKKFQKKDFLPVPECQHREQYHNKYEETYKQELTINPKYCVGFYPGYEIKEQDGKIISAKVGLLDSSGNLVIPKEFTTIFFSDSLFFGAGDLGYKVFDFNGKALSNDYFSWAAVINQNLNQILVQKEGKFGLMRKDGFMILPFNYDEIIYSQALANTYFFKQGKLYGMMRADSYYQTPPFSPTYGLTQLKPGFFSYRNNGKYFLIDTLGRQFLESSLPIYTMLSNTRFIVGNYRDYYLSDEKGEHIRKKSFSALFELKKDFMVAGSLWGKSEKLGVEGPEYFEILNFEGEPVLKRRFSLIKKISDDCLLVLDENETNAAKYRLIDYEGKSIIDEKVEDVGLLTGDVYYIRTKNGFRLVKIRKDKIYRESPEVKSFQLIHQDLFAVYNGEFWALMNTQFDFLSTYVIQEVQKFKGDIGAVKIRGKYVVFNSLGHLIVDSDFEKCEILEDNLVYVRKGGLSGILNSKGQVVVPMIYQELKVVYDKKKGFRFGVKSKGKWGVVDLLGEKIVPFEFDSFAEISVYASIEQKRTDGFYAFMIKTHRRTVEYHYFNFDENKNQRIINENYTFGFEKTSCQDGFGRSLQGVKNWNGQEVIPCKYTYIGDFKHFTFRFAQGTKVGLMDTTGKVVIPANTQLMYDVSGDDKLLQTGRHYGNWGLWTYSGKMIADTLYGGFEKPVGKLIPFYASFNHRIENGQMVHDGKKIGFMDFSGKIVIEAVYDYYTVNGNPDSINGSFLINLKKDDKWYVYDPKKRQIKKWE